MPDFASRAGNKLQFALDQFQISPKNLICADFGSSTGGFVDCLLQNGAEKVYSVDTSYGELAWELRSNPKVKILERTNAMHVSLPEKVDLITIDVGWTKQIKVLPNAFLNLKDNGQIISLIKPHYEADKKLLQKGKLPEEEIKNLLNLVKQAIETLGCVVENIVESPIEGKRRGNHEFLCHISHLN
jgi:23S rRNA (cytidine1920-2'-O)/16S rRNA (cytidine1409-2'-O)-methyltransferase